MDILKHMLDTYASFFDWHMWAEVLTDPVSWGLIGTLVVLEGLLSADNALVLAVMVKHLPEKQRKKGINLRINWRLFLPFSIHWRRDAAY
ncbi:hypothetical protein BsIDN1_05110 [Bacillus safensis]|uniref:Uncharacterized protein n=1 Tax=Bacillus safensis TaxID=561879 RepID=A0A5S9M174_BACIA|nr:hypothetical protein BsIDN1_05110 [Bacillus safensis]